MHYNHTTINCKYALYILFALIRFKFLQWIRIGYYLYYVLYYALYLYVMYKIVYIM